MTKLKLGPIHDGQPVKLTVELLAEVHRDLCDYAAVFGHQTRQDLKSARLVAHAYPLHVNRPKVHHRVQSGIQGEPQEAERTSSA